MSHRGLSGRSALLECIRKSPFVRYAPGSLPAGVSGLKLLSKQLTERRGPFAGLILTHATRSRMGAGLESGARITWSSPLLLRNSSREYAPCSTRASRLCAQSELGDLRMDLVTEPSLDMAKPSS